ncbi:coatomer subunit zeta-3, partial [Trifolium pratense]
GSNTHATRVPPIKPVVVSQPENLDDPRNAYQGPDSFDDVPKVPRLEETHQKFKAIEDRLSMMEGGKDPLDLANMCLVPDLVLPPKFKVPDFEKYKGLSCPKNHLIMYSRKMASFANDDKLMMHCFQDSLTGASLNWYMQLEGSRIRSWRDLANAFIKQYQYNIDLAPDRAQLQNMSQKEGELFKVYAQRWRELAAQVRPPLSETEMADMFTNTLQGAYYEKMVGSVSSGFADLVKIGERIENGLKSGKIQAAVGNQNVLKKSTSGFVRKKEGEANVVTSKNNKSYPAIPAHVPYFPFPYLATAQHQLPQGYPTPQIVQAPANHAPQPTQQQARKIFDPIPVPYSQLLPYLVHGGMVIPRALKPMTPPFPAWYDANSKCEFHAGTEGHATDNCRAFKHKVQELLDKKLLTFKENGPNVKDNPLPGHNGPSVNQVEGSEELIKEAIRIKTPLAVIRETLLSFDQFQGMHHQCKVCDENPNHCVKMRECLQGLMNQGLVQIGYAKKESTVLMLEQHEHEKCLKPIEIIYRKLEVPVEKPESLVVHVPSPFPFKSTKVVPWNYDTSAYIQGKPMTIPDPVVINIDGLGRMTRSGRVFAPEQPQKSIEITSPPKDNEAPTSSGQVELSKGKDKQDEMDEFLKIIKKSDYKVVDQLSQTPSKISILSLLMSSEAHRAALLKLLTTAHVNQDITVDQFDGVCNNITASRCLGFTDAELPSEGPSHNKALHISMKCQDNTIA